MQDNNNGTKTERFYTAQELADLLHISLSYAYELMATKQIRHVKIGRLRRIKQSDIDAYLEKRTNEIIFD